VPVHIPDLGTATSTLSIAGFSGTVGHLTVSLNITHGYDPDLSADLTSPAGTHVNLFGGLSGRGVNFDNTTFDDNAATLVTDANGFGSYTGYYRPIGALSALNGEDPNGVWTLRVHDTIGGYDGSLDSWSIQLNGTETTTTTNAAGGYQFTALAPGGYDVREVGRSGWIPSEPSNGVHLVTLSAAEDSSGGNNFGAFEPPGNIRGRLYLDKNGNSAFDTSDPTLSGWTVYLDANNNGIKDPSEQSVASDTSGNYAFDQITPGQYVVRVQVPVGYTQLSPGVNGAILVSQNRTAGTTRGGKTGGSSTTRSTTPKVTRASGPNRKFSTTDVLADLNGRAVLTDLNNYIARNPTSSIRNLFDLSRGKSLQILRTSSRTTLAQLRLKPRVDPQQAVAALKQIPLVRWASLNYVYDTQKLGDPREFTPNDPDFNQQWFHTVMHDDQAWDTTTGSSNIVVAITDDGLDLAHPDFAGGIWTNSDEIAGDGIDNDNNGYIDDVHGWDFWSETTTSPPCRRTDTARTWPASSARARTTPRAAQAPPAERRSCRSASGAPTTPTSGPAPWSLAPTPTRWTTARTSSRPATTSMTSPPIRPYIASVQYIYDHGVLDFNSAGNYAPAEPATTEPGADVLRRQHRQQRRAQRLEQLRLRHRPGRAGHLHLLNPSRRRIRLHDRHQHVLAQCGRCCGADLVGSSDLDARPGGRPAHRDRRQHRRAESPVSPGCWAQGA
jgi:subtilisin-like proprotein convertase family protein